MNEKNANKWISVKEAIALSNKSESFFRRLIRKSQDSPFDKSKNSYLTSQEINPDQSKNIQLTRLICKKQNHKWLIDKESLISVCGIRNDNVNGHDMSLNNNLNSQDQSDLITVLQERINFLESQIKEKDELINRLTILLQNQQRKITYEPEKELGVFSKILIKFGL